jgi:hypothetical protein
MQDDVIAEHDLLAGRRVMMSMVLSSLERRGNGA